MLRCRSGAFENVDHARELDDVGLIVETPFEGVHQAVVVLVHRLIHPDRVGDVEADGHVELGSFFPDGVHARVVGMHAGSLDFAAL